MNLSVILPIYNEGQVIKKTITEILRKIPKYCSKLEIIAVDDGSSDVTNKILQDLSKKDQRVKVITHSQNKGYGAALLSGVNTASYEWILFMDSDMQFDVNDLKQFVDKTKKYDFIIGFRKHRADNLKRRLVSHVYNRMIRLLFGLKIKDVDCAFKLMKKSAIKKASLYSSSFFVSVELMVKAHKNKHSILEIGVEHFPRQLGTSKVSAKHVVKTLFDLARLYKTLT